MRKRNKKFEKKLDPKQKTRIKGGFGWSGKSSQRDAQHKRGNCRPDFNGEKKVSKTGTESKGHTGQKKKISTWYCEKGQIA